MTREPMAAARAKADAAFDLFRVLDVPFYTFHDRDIAPEGEGLAGRWPTRGAMGEVLAQKQAATGVKLLWGTANLFSHPRFMAGAATTPGSGGLRLVGRDGEDRPRGDASRGRRQLRHVGRPRRLRDPAQHRPQARARSDAGASWRSWWSTSTRSVFSGPILIEPKPKEPTKHQYDFGRRDGLRLPQALRARAGREGEPRREPRHFGRPHVRARDRGGQCLRHPGLARTSTAAIRCSAGTQDQFPNDVPQLTLALHEVIRGGGLTTGGLNFDAKIRRQSIDAEDLVHAHVGGIDICAQAFLAAARLVEAGTLTGAVAERYAGWDRPGHAASGGTLAEIAAAAESNAIDPRPRSGRQERLEKPRRPRVNPGDWTGPSDRPSARVATDAAHPPARGELRVKHEKAGPSGPAFSASHRWRGDQASVSELLHRAGRHAREVVRQKVLRAPCPSSA